MALRRIAFVLFATVTAAVSQAVILVPDAWVDLPGIAGPGGTVIEDDVVGFSFSAYGGTVSGSVQNRVIQQGDGTLVFAWRLFNDANSAGVIQDFRLGNFLLPVYDSDWSNTSLGDEGPNRAFLFLGSGGFINYNFAVTGGAPGLRPGLSSKFIFIMSDATAYDRSALYDLTNVGQSEISDAFTTFAPVPEPASIAILGLGAAAFLRRRRR